MPRIIILVLFFISLTVLAQKKISELPSLTESQFDTADLFTIVDVTGSGTTKKTTVGDLDLRYFKNISVLGVANGGTGASTYTDGDLLIGSGTTITKLARSATPGYFLTTSGTTLAWANTLSATTIFDASITSPTITGPTITGANITSSTISEGSIPSLQTTKITSGVFGLDRGGTGVSVTTTGGLLVGSGTTTFVNRPIGTTGQVLTVSGGTAVWSTPSSGGGYGPFTNYTPTIAGFTGVTVHYSSCRQDAETVHCMIEMTATGAASPASISIPVAISGTYNANTVAGIVGHQLAGVNAYAIVGSCGSTSVCFGRTDSGNSPLTIQNGNNIAATATRVTLNFTYRK